MTKTTFQICGNKIHREGREIQLRGINIGNWLNLEDFMMGLPGTDWQMRAFFREQFGRENEARFFSSLEENFITEDDIRFLSEKGFNLIRIPLNYRRFEEDANPYHYLETGFRPVDRLMNWCQAYGIGVLLDLHAAQGGQNTTPPADNTTGYAMLWISRDYQDRCVALWEEFVRRYRNHPALFGYNLLNEPITNQNSFENREEQVRSMNRLNHRLCSAIRKLDHLTPIIIEGNVRPSGGVATLDSDLFADPNTVVSYHAYPLFNCTILPGLNAGTEEKDAESESSLADFEESVEASIQNEIAYVRKVNRPMLLGEFGFFNPSSPSFAKYCSLPSVSLQERLVTAQLKVNVRRNFHWCVWSYKDVSLMGLMTPDPTTPWKKFVEDPTLLDIRHAAEVERKSAFNRINTLFEKESSNALIFDAAWNDSVRGKNRAEQAWMMKKLATTYPIQEILRMPESFHFRNCRISQLSWRVLERFLA